VTAITDNYKQVILWFYRKYNKSFERFDRQSVEAPPCMSVCSENIRSKSFRIEIWNKL